VPKLWSDTIETHRHDVREAILNTTATLAAKHGLLSVTMSEVAEATGIGRATLYKYFADVEEILRSWHARQVAMHLGQLTEARDQSAPGGGLQAVLATYARITRESKTHGGQGLAAFLHGDAKLETAQQQLHALIRQLLAEGARSGTVRNDVPPDELAHYCLHAISAARSLSAPAAVARLVAVTLAGVQTMPRRTARATRVRRPRRHQP
jgi:AcrR family transcriptional regulator